MKTRTSMLGAGLAALALLAMGHIATTPATADGQVRQVDITIPADVVVPVSLNEELSSNHSQVGDHFGVTITTHRMGDSEFPPGTRLKGVVTEAQPRDKKQPGVLDVDFNMAILPNGTSVPVHGRLASLDSKDVHTTRHGRLVANDTSPNRSKAVGIGAGAGYVVGHVILGHGGVVSGLVGAIGGLLFSHHKKTADVDLKPGTQLGVLLDQPVTYSDTTGYGSYRDRYLAM